MYTWALPLSRIIAGIALTALFIFPIKSDAKVWKNSYIAFELPSGWDCYLENTAWICRHAINKTCLGSKSNSADCKNQRKRTREAIIILAAKERGPQDSAAAYVKHLKTPRPIVTRKGKRTQSRVIHIRPNIKINGQPWVDGKHLSSEIPGYYTRYVATIKQNIAVLVTFSAHKLYYTKYSEAFSRAIQSMRISAKSLNDVKHYKKQGDSMFGPNREFDLDPLPEDIEEPTVQPFWVFDKPNALYFITLFIFILGAIMAFIIAKKKKR